MTGPTQLTRRPAAPHPKGGAAIPGCLEGGPASNCRRRLHLFLGLLLIGLAPELQAFTFRQTSSPVFYIDTSVTPPLQATYVAYQINNNSGVSYPDLWAGIDSFSGGSVALGPQEDGLVHLGALAPGETKTAFFYLQANQETAVPQAHTVRLYSSRPPAAELASQSFSLTVEETIQANANQVDTVVAGPNPPLLGGVVKVTVRGSSGTIGSAQAMVFNPAAYLSWRPDAYELIGAQITLSGGNAGTYTDTLYILATSPQSTDYIAVYSYRTVGSTQTPTPVSPICFISSGTQIKHTRVDNYAQFDPILPADNRLTLGKTAAPAQLASGGPVSFTLTATNAGMLECVLEDFTDTLPDLPGGATYVPGSARYAGLPLADPLVQGSVLTWIGMYFIPAGAVRSLTFQANLPPLNGTYTNQAVAHIGASQIDTTLSTLDNAPATATVLVRIPVVSGFVYLDANRNLQRDEGEPGTGLPLFAKLVSAEAAGGPARQAVSVEPAGGRYAFTNVPPGHYFILLDDNAALNDITPTVPAGWTGTEMPGHLRTNVVITTVDVPNQNFGLVNGTTLTGQVFQDTGAGGGQPHDGIRNGTEAGVTGARLRLTDETESATYATATSDGDGRYTLFVPATLADGMVLRVRETNPNGFLSVSGSAGNTGGSYDRATDTISFSFRSGASYANVDFGDAPLNQFVPDHQQAGLPGAFVLYAHTFTAGSAGQVSFLGSSQPTPVLPGWNHVLYRDNECNGQLDPTDAPLPASLPVSAGEQVCILVKEGIPIGAPLNARDIVTVTAIFVYAGVSPELSTEHSVTDITVAGPPTAVGLTLLKRADKETAKPGEAITYTIIYANTSSGQLQNITLYDSTPAYTTFLGATNGPLPANLSAVVLTAPAPGSPGVIRWTFSGALAPGHSGSVSFQVELER